MGSWAKVVRLDATAQEVPCSTPAKTAGKTTAVVDTNAIVAGLQLHALADRVVTTREVLKEVRDAKSRENLATLPFGIEALEPAFESLTAVTRFARATGDLQSLSDVDLKILALSHTLEHEAVGSAHLRSLPAQQAVQKKPLHSSQGLPGWGDTGATWSQLDKLNEEEEQMHGAATITDGIQDLSLNTSINVLEQQRGTEASQLDDERWERAAKSNAAARQRRRKEQRRQQRVPQHACEPLAGKAQQAEEAARSQPDSLVEGCSLAGPAEPQVASVLQQKIALGHRANLACSTPPVPAECNRGRPGPEQQVVGRAAAAQRKRDSTLDAAGLHAIEPAEASIPDASNAATEADDHPVAVSNQPATQSDDADSSNSSSPRSDSSGSGGLDFQDPFARGTSDQDTPSDVIIVASPITCVTADFAMQNVLLQMGLQLQAPNGLRLRHVSRFAQRCSACFFVIKEGSGIFCPRCGNAALQKVEVTIGSNGEEVCGVQKKHVLRGTRYSLPKPKGGKKSKDPILREDMMLQRRQRKPKKVEAEEGVDPLEQLASRPSESAFDQALAARLPNGRRNPNERTNVRTNRRKR